MIARGDVSRFLNWNKSKLPACPEIFCPVDISKNIKSTSGMISVVSPSNNPIPAQFDYRGIPAVTGLIGIVERHFEKPLSGTITEKNPWLDKIIKVTILGEHGVLYSHSDGIDRISKDGLHYIAVEEREVETKVRTKGKTETVKEIVKITKKIPASKVNLSYEH